MLLAAARNSRGQLHRFGLLPAGPNGDVTRLGQLRVIFEMTRYIGNLYTPSAEFSSTWDCGQCHESSASMQQLPPLILGGTIMNDFTFSC